jgi:hypothetical protein
MKLFFYKSDKFNPLLFIITKISNKEEMIKLEALSHEIFQILIDQNYANNKNIIIFSVIKDYDKTTENLILPSIKSNINLIDKCHKETRLINNLIIEILVKSETEFYIEILSDKILINSVHLNLMAFSKFYKY